MRRLAIFVLVISAGLSAGALAANQMIHQQGRVFGPDNVSVKKGEALTFLNDDTIPHNIMSASKGNEFNLGSQRSGDVDRRDVQGSGRRAGDLCDPSAHEDDGQGYRLVLRSQVTGDSRCRSATRFSVYSAS